MKIANHFNFAAAFLISIILCPYNGRKSFAEKYLNGTSIIFNGGKSVIAKSKTDVQLHEVPVLCYHQIREWKNTDSRNSRTYIMPPESFRKQMKILADRGYHYILPAQLVAYMKAGGKLTQKPIMITFDDGTAHQFTNAIPILNDYGFKAVFFIMTVVLNHENYVSS